MDAIPRNEFEVWDQWHAFGIYCGYPNSFMAPSQRRVLDREPDLMWVFRLGIRLSVVLQSGMGENDELPVDQNPAGD